MIIYPAGLVASEEAAGRPLSRPRIGYQTYTRDTGVIVTASSELAAYPKDNPLRPDTVDRWKGSAMPVEWKIDFGSSKSIGYVGLAAHTIGLCAGSLTIATSPDNSAWTTWSVVHAPTDDSPIFALDTPRSARYMRCSITGSSVPHIGVINVGPVLTVERAIFGGYKPLNTARKTEGESNESDSGNFMGKSIRKKGVETIIPLSYLTQAWIDSTFDDFIKSARLYPFFFAWRPLTYTKHVGYVWTPPGDDINPTFQGELDYMEARIKVTGIGHD